jgi:hypothetical protein
LACAAYTTIFRPEESEVSTGLWTNDRVPKSGWVCVEVIDLGAARPVCQMCLKAHIRYAHTVTHPNSHTLRVGVCCSGNLEGSPLGARARESVFRLREARRARWATKPWRRAKSGVAYLNSDGVSIRVYGVPGGFMGVIASLIDDWRIVGKRVFSSEEAAQAAAIKHLFTAKPETGVK